MTEKQTARTHRTQCSPPQEDCKKKSQTRKTTVSPPPAEEAGRKLRYRRSRNGRKKIRNSSNRSSSRNGHKGRRSQWSMEITTDCSFTHNTWRSQQAIVHWKLQEKHCKYRKTNSSHLQRAIKMARNRSTIHQNWHKNSLRTNKVMQTATGGSTNETRC